jgi:hypothetical protein
MKSDREIKSKVDAVLNSIDNIERANPSPYFYNKVLAKITSTKQSVWENWISFFLRPAIAFSIICFIVVINAFVLYSNLDSSNAEADTTEVAVSDEYNESLTALYYLENEKP